MVGITEAGAALSGLKTAYDLAKGVQSLTNDANVRLATIELMQTILSAQQAALAAQEAQSALQRRVKELEDQIANADRWDEEKARYELKEYPTGSLVYQLREDAANGEPVHRLCPTCFEKRVKSVLQVTSKHSGGEVVTCQPCGHNIKLSNFSHGQIRTAPRSSDYY